MTTETTMAQPLSEAEPKSNLDVLVEILEKQYKSRTGRDLAYLAPEVSITKNLLMLVLELNARLKVLESRSNGWAETWQVPNKYDFTPWQPYIDCAVTTLTLPLTPDKI